MRKTLVYSALISLVITCGIIFLANQMDWLTKERTIEIQKEGNSIPNAQALYTMNEEGEMVALDFTVIAENVKDAVVHISSLTSIQQRRNYDPFEEFMDDPFYEFFFGPRRPRPEQKPQYRKGSGSGVIISEDGYIITNNHVVKDAETIEITLLDKSKFEADVIGTDPTTDIALLKIDGKDLPKLEFYDSDLTKVGEWVMAVGNPFNLNSTVTAGIVSAKGRSIQILNENYAVESFIQTDAAINPGNSGGALVNLQGDLIGINTAIASPTGAYAGYGFAVPSNIVKKVIEDLMEYGVVQRGFLGIMIREVNSDLAKDENLKVTNGVLIDSLTEGSAAKDAGIRQQDVILRVDGAEVNSVPKLQELIARKRPGDAVRIDVNRFGQELNFEVYLKNKDGEERFVEARTLSSIEESLGVEFEDINEEIAKKLNVNGGVKISRISRGKIKDNTNVRPGFVITKIDRQPIRDKDHLLRVLKDKSGGILVEGKYENDPSEYFFGLGI